MCELDGWAIEARIYAEDPTRNFLPSIGRLVRYLPPRGRGHPASTAGVFEGAEISDLLRPDDRQADRLRARPRRGDRAAARRARRVLCRRRAAQHRRFSAAIAAKPRFRAGALSTDFIAEEFPGGFAPPAEFDRSRPGDPARRRRWRERRMRERETAIDGSSTGAREIRRRLTMLLDGRACTRLRCGRRRRPTGRDRRREPPRRDRLAAGPAAAAAARSRTASRPCRSSGCRARLSGWRMAASIRRAQVLPPRAAELLALMPEKAGGRHLAPGAVADAGPADRRSRSPRGRRSRPASRLPSSRR